MDDKEIKKVFGEEYAGLVGSIQELLDEVIDAGRVCNSRRTA